MLALQLRRCVPLSAAIFPSLRRPVAVTLSQSRGKKQNFGGITRDPFKTFQKKLGQKQQKRHAKAPLETDERAQQKLQLPITMKSLGQIISAYVPLEKFAKAPFYSKAGIAQRSKAFKENIVIIYAGAVIRRRLRKIDPFRPIEFAHTAQEMFKNVNTAIQMKDKQVLRQLTTENASESLKEEFEHKSFEWQIVSELERPRVVSARVAPFLTKDNLFGQVTVRMHTEQLLAVYNSAGSLIRGHPSRPRDVIDYVVFERHLVKPESTWKIAGKIPPQRPWREVEEAAKRDRDRTLTT